MAQRAPRRPAPAEARPYLVRTVTRPRLVRPWTRWSDWATLVLGIWYVLSPWLLAVSTMQPRAMNNWVAGGALVLLSVWLLAVPSTVGVAWLNALLGIWILVSPWALNLGAWPHQEWNSWAIGALTFMCASWTAATARRVSLGGRLRP